MQRILSQTLPAHAGSQALIQGWVHRRRELKSVAFLIVRDRSGLAQVVVTDPATRAQLSEIPEETVVSVEGKVTANPTAPGGVEIVEAAITPLTEPARAAPFELYRPELGATLPTRLDYAPVALRHPRHREAVELLARATHGFRQSLDALGFTEIHTPKIVESATESGANVFAIDYFGAPAYLAQSPQFYKQMMVGVLERVYEVGPVFRAEPHETGRHLAQYTSLDVEFGFIRDHFDVMAVLREVIAGMVAATGGELTVPEQIPHVHFADAVGMVGEALGEDLSGEPDLAPAHERWLGEWARREHGSEFVFVVGYPMRKRPFYTHPQPDRPEFSNSFDLVFRGMELATGGQRLHRYSDYVRALGGDTAPYESYLATFAHGMPPHGGFAIGLERFVARLTGAANIRETTLFPRDRHRLTP
jgi:nondiscriminating aspartyl-tRNA synthetase